MQSSWRWEKWQQYACVAKCNTQNPAVRADIYLSSWISRYDPERLHCPSCSNPLSGSRYQIIPACYRNNCNLFLFCMKWGCLWSSRHYLPKAKFPFTSRVQKVLFVYFRIVHLLCYQHLFQIQNTANLRIKKYASSVRCLDVTKNWDGRPFWIPVLQAKSLFRKLFPLANDARNSKDQAKNKTKKEESLKTTISSDKQMVKPSQKSGLLSSLIWFCSLKRSTRLFSYRELNTSYSWSIMRVKKGFMRAFFSEPLYLSDWIRYNTVISTCSAPKSWVHRAHWHLQTPKGDDCLLRSSASLLLFPHSCWHPEASIWECTLPLSEAGAKNGSQRVCSPWACCRQTEKPGNPSSNPPGGEWEFSQVHLRPKLLQKGDTYTC